MYVDQNVAGQKLDLLSVSYINMAVIYCFFVFVLFFYKAEDISKVMLFALAFYEVSIH